MLYIPKAIRFGIECDAYLVVKRFPRTYQDFQKYLTKEVQSYYTPFPCPALQEGFDWGGVDDYTGFMILTTFVKGDHGMEKLETLVLQDSNVYIMDKGVTVDKLKI
jgi:hypothetical protein